MRIANLAGRATIVTDAGLIDLAASSDGAFSSSVDKCVTQLGTIRAWLLNAAPRPIDLTTPSELLGDARLGPVVANPQQIFAVGVNYRRHAEEMGLVVPKEPMVFTKFVSSLCGPNDDVPIPSATTDFEAELVVVIGTKTRDVSVEDALGVVAGYCVGQDFSERSLQMLGSPPQFSLGKSFRHFAPVGPWLTTADEVEDPNDLVIRCSVSGTQYQDSSTSDMVFSVAEVVSYLSGVVELRPGDLIFTGSPHGVGQGQRPPVFLQPGDSIVTSIERLGRIENHAV
ncbi:MAG: fumarylacetoacetate hydrolase [Acidimicrobiaceae bacterium]|nr:fumarylacetoacetate hydrolase [Acidimicrobiaceae bacterium]